MELTDLDILIMILVLASVAVAICAGLAVHLYWLDKENKRLRKELEQKQHATPAQ